MNLNMDKKKRIDRIWNSNSKIPFMQSKDILTYGYDIGFQDATSTKTCKTEEYKTSQTFGPKTELATVLDEDPEFNRLTGMREAYYKAKYDLETGDRLSAYRDISEKYQDVVKKIRDMQNDKGKDRRDRKK